MPDRNNLHNSQWEYTETFLSGICQRDRPGVKGHMRRPSAMSASIARIQTDADREIALLDEMHEALANDVPRVSGGHRRLPAGPAPGGDQTP